MTTLKDQPWLSDARTTAVLDALEAAGGQARFVGGSVRNALMGQVVDDLDLATTLKPEAAMAALKTAGLKVVPTGLAHGTVTAVSGGWPYEITTLRRDVETDGRKAVVAFTDDWAADAARRDFRLNALYADRAGTVFDPTGEGVADARTGRVVFVGEPETRIREDYLRILRFFRFFAWYGRGEPDAAGLAACGALVEGMDRLSAERVSKELLKLLAAPDPRAAARAMDRTGVLRRALPEAVGPERFEAMVGLSQDAGLRLSALLPGDEAGLRSAATRLRLANGLRDRLIAAGAAEASLDMADKETRAMIYRDGRSAFQDRVMRAWADAPGRGAEAERLLTLADGWAAPTLPVGGREIARLGVEPGPETGRALKAFEDGWVEDDFPAEGHEARLKAVVSCAEALDPDRLLDSGLRRNER